MPGTAAPMTAVETASPSAPSREGGPGHRRRLRQKGEAERAREADLVGETPRQQGPTLAARPNSTQ